MNLKSLLILFLIFASACLSSACGERKEENTSLKVFESTNSLQEEASIPEAENKSQIKDETSSEDNTEKVEELELEHTEVETKKTKEEKLSILSQFKIPNLDLKIIGLDTDQNKLLLYSRYNLTITENLNDYTTILDPEIFKKNLSEDMPGISSAKIITADIIWVSFSNGLSILYKDNKWNKLDGGPYNIKKSIKSIVKVSNQIALATNGLFLWGLETERFISNQEIRDISLSKVVELDNNTIGLVSSNLFFKLTLPEKTLSYGFSIQKEDAPLSDVLAKDNNYLLATNQGILTISKDNLPISRVGENFAIKEFANIPNTNSTLVRTSSGIGLLNNTGLKVLELESGPQLNSLAIFKEQLLLGSKEEGIFKLSLDELTNFIHNNQNKEVTKDFNQTFENACIAAEKILDNKNYSASITKANTKNGTYTFIDQKQVCPYGAGRMFADGSLLIILNDTIQKTNGSLYKEIKLPEKITASDVTSITENSKGQIYLGTKSGLFYLPTKESNAKDWILERSSKELAEDLISDFVFDRLGNMWVSTRIKKVDKEPEAVNLDYKPLHILTENGWAHFGSKNGITSKGISSLSSRDGNIFLGTADGISVIKKDMTITLFNRAAGLKKNIVENFSLDQAHRIWITSSYFQSGISFIEGDSIYEAEKKDGLLSDRIEHIGLDSESRIWLLDTKGRTQVISEELFKTSAKKSPFFEARGEAASFIP